MSIRIDIPNASRARDLRQSLLAPSPESVRSSILSSRISASEQKTRTGLYRNLESEIDVDREYVDCSDTTSMSEEARPEQVVGWPGSNGYNTATWNVHVNMEVLSPTQVSGVLITLWVSVIASLLFAVYEEQWFRPKFTLNSSISCYSQFSLGIDREVCANLQGLNCSNNENIIQGVLNGTTPFNGFFSLRGQVEQAKTVPTAHCARGVSPASRPTGRGGRL